MDAPYPVLDGHVDAEEVTGLLQRGNAACLVRDGGELSGIITRYDVVRALIVVERFLPRPIPRRDQTLPRAVPKREGELTVETTDDA